jgi:hypothetical protein
MCRTGYPAVPCREGTATLRACVKQVALRHVDPLGAYFVHKLQNARHNGGLVHLCQAA